MLAIPHIHAQTFTRTMSDARTRPGLFYCRSEGNQSGEYVVKYFNQLKSNIVCEFIAALLGQHLGLPIPPIAIVHINPRLVPAITDINTRTSLTKDPGPHFGSKHLTGQFSINPYGFSIPKNLVSQAFDIFAFDMLIQNTDRSDQPHQGKPNLLFNGEQLVIIDHELALGFEGLVGPPPPPWQLRDQPWAKHHLFYRQLARNIDKINFKRFLTQLTTVSDTLLDEITNAIPENWRNPTKVDKIMTHLKTARDNIERFEQGLREVFV